MPFDLDDQRDLEDLAEFTANNAILASQENITKAIKRNKLVNDVINDEIDQISDLKILEGIESILATMRSEKEKLVKEVDGKLGEEKKKWQETSKATKNLVKESLKVFQDYFLDCFQDDENKPDLCGFDSNGVFAKNMIAHLKINPTECRGIMNSFCDYILALSYLSNEEMVTKLESFPPKISTDINCLGGSGSDIDDLIKKMTVSAEDNNLFEIHQLISTQLVSKFNQKVYAGNHKHTPPFLSFLLGVESKEVIMNVVLDPHYKLPRSDISTHRAHDEIRQYFESFKNHLKQNVSDEIRNEALNKIILFQENYNANNLVFTPTQEDKNLRSTISAEEKTTVISLMKLALKPIFQDGKEVMVEDDDNYLWDERKITQHVLRGSVNRLFPEYPSKWEEPSEEAKKELQEDNKLLQRINNPNLLTESATQDLIFALKSDKKDLLSAGIRNLWLIGAKFQDNHPMHFTNIIDELTDPKDGSIGIFTFEDETKKTIKLNPKFTENFSVSNKDKLDEMPEHYQTHMASSNIIAYRRHISRTQQEKEIYLGSVPFSEITTLIEGNATKEEIVASIGIFSTLPSLERLITNNKLSLSQPLIAQLLKRTDCTEIIQLLKNTGISFSPVNYRIIVESAIEENNEELYVAARKDDNVRTNYYLDVIIDVRQYKTDEALLLLKFHKKHDPEDIFRKKLNQHAGALSLIHWATIRGNIKIIEFLAENGADLNSRVKMDHIIGSIELRNGQTSAHLAASLGKTNIIQLLRTKDADLDQHDTCLRRPIHCAINGNHFTTLEELVGDNNEDGKVNIKKTPLSKTTILKQLPNLSEDSPATLAVRKKRLQCLKILINNGLIIEAAELNKLAQMVANLIPESNVITSVQDQSKEMLEYLLRQGASSPYFPSPPTYIKNILDRHDHFEAVARAITKTARNNVKKTFLVNDRDLVKFKNTICQQLIDTYDYNSEEMLTDFKLTPRDGLEINGRMISYEDTTRRHLPRFKLSLEKKYNERENDRVEILGEILANKITSLQERPIKNLPLEKTKLNLSNENAASFIETLSSRDGIRDAIRVEIIDEIIPEKITTKPSSSVRVHPERTADTDHIFKGRIFPSSAPER